LAHRLPEPGPSEEADHDRRGAVQDVRHEPHDPAESARPVLGEIEPGADPDREPDERGEPDDDPRSHDRVGHAAARLAGRDGVLDEEAPVEGRSAFGDQIPEDEDEGDRKSTRLNSSHGYISYAVFCLKKKKKKTKR